MEKKFIFLEHTADIKFKAFGETLNELFENVAIAVSNYLSRGEKVKASKGKVINVNGDDYESLLYNFIDEILYLLDAEHFLTAKADIIIRGFNLKAELYGDDSSNYQIDHIKAATYSEMYVKKKDFWEAPAVLDV